MIFNTFAYYLLFLLPSAALFRLAPSQAKPWVCVVFGAGFFTYFSYTVLGGFWPAACLAIFAFEALLSRWYAPAAIACRIGVSCSLIVLFVFKYWNFFTGLATAPFGQNPLYWDAMFLPLGVSFFTFEFIHYAVDRYRGKVERGTLGEYLAFIFFFPTLVAGPIKRFQDFVVCLRAPSTDWPLDVQRGLTRILSGLVKKFVLADFLTSITNHLNAEDIASADRSSLLIWATAYSFKIYFDWTAYSDIAIGSGRLFGIRIPENFNWPILAANITDFWRRWHMSLTRWLTDYIFIPAGGSRGSLLRTCRNMVLVMLVSGLWHGAAFNYLAWAAGHAVLLVGHRFWRERFPVVSTNKFLKLLSWAATFALVTLLWVFFACKVDVALLFYQRLFWS